MTTRRTLLLGGFGAGVFVAAASGWAWMSVGYSLPPNTVAIALTEKELAVVAALTEALVPGEDGMPNGVALGVPQRVDEEVWAAPPAIQSDLKAAQTNYIGSLYDAIIARVDFLKATGQLP